VPRTIAVTPCPPTRPLMARNAIRRRKVPCR
jgi:hypothetical protein